MSRSVPESLATALADRYELLRKLGVGGMATVYLARDVKHGREVAIKLLHPELAAVLGAERFLSEIRTTASLQHPHILPLFDSGEAGGQARDRWRPLARAHGVDETSPAVSPDGRWLAYASDESGSFEVYVRSLTRDGDAVRISIEGGTGPLWGARGNTLYYRGRTFVESAVLNVAPLTVVKRETLFRDDQLRTGTRTWGVLADEEQFIMLRSVAVREITVEALVDWRQLPALLARPASAP